MRLPPAIVAIAAATLLVACEDRVTYRDHGSFPDAPVSLDAQAHWVLEDFTSAGQPLGYAVADVTWLPPSNWDQEVFRVYSRRFGTGSWYLIATITSCTEDGCVYRDRGVSDGLSYEYYVSTFDENTDLETRSSSSVRATVPPAATPATPVPDSAVGLDGAAWLQWHDGGNGGKLWKYVVYLTHIDAKAYLQGIGETDSPGFLDARSSNGHVYGYRVAALDTTEHVSALSREILVAPRPDALGELVYSHQSDPTQSGFLFQPSEATSPIVPGASASANWRLEVDAAGWRIVPLNGTQVLEYPGRTTALTCGPGADAECRAATRAPLTGYLAAPVNIRPEYSYVFRIPGSDGQHYGVLRVAILGSDSGGHNLAIVDWAYQLIPGDVRLTRVAR
jgi:hypothetical protein